ncbi:hypothetical protein TraAM80_02105 [Trypanosoma rangeli]|uniref:Uncharacterized protein n=1 Tax=Trypanosoma rangeli TaxID=5698 RepID=A0A3S5IS04_TRYRA|nr:uncharacterized protein TraAM80_02105 [Trypanosoma rangeli]RNF09497.1 hypothetical protein TraAM80_02105 [Trypanosoma rangeli]|eukprot:RNF09497.1 hypothetical protein TraAM80_02105 [Trypanosoma rangeli]
MLRRTARFARTPVSAFLHEPSQRKTFDETLAQCSANGTDMASGLTSDFASLQSKLLKYRIVRLRDELQYVRHHPFNSMPSFFGLLKHTVLLTLVFLIFRNIARLSLSPLEEPPTDSAVTTTPETTDMNAPPQKKKGNNQTK